MFDPCRKWRHKLTLRDEGRLPVSQWGALEDHLACCPRCRVVQEADQALHDVLGISLSLRSQAENDAFDARVLAALRTPAMPPVHPVHPAFSGLLRLRMSALPFRFLSQMAGGTLVAASLTALCLSFSLRVPGIAPASRSRTVALPPAMATRNEPPVPLETLLQTPTPRAALLWATPAEPKKAQTDLRAPRATPNLPAKKSNGDDPNDASNPAFQKT
jgi:hypothetical protein